MLMQPSQADVRRFFCGVYARSLAGAVLEPMERLLSAWMGEHPEYHAALADVDEALRTMQQVDALADNPFLHLSMHLSISEQCSIDQPQGIRQAVDTLALRLGSLHQAHHHAMDCLGQMVFESQRSGSMPDAGAYLACIQRRVSRD